MLIRTNGFRSFFLYFWSTFRCTWQIIIRKTLKNAYKKFTVEYVKVNQFLNYLNRIWLTLTYSTVYFLKKKIFCFTDDGFLGEPKRRPEIQKLTESHLFLLLILYELVCHWRYWRVTEDLEGNIYLNLGFFFLCFVLFLVISHIQLPTKVRPASIFYYWKKKTIFIYQRKNKSRNIYFSYK